MTKGQWTIIGLIGFLLLLEAGRSKTVQQYLTGIWTNFNSSLSAASNAPTGLKTTNASGGCPPGQNVFVVAGGKRVCR